MISIKNIIYSISLYPAIIYVNKQFNYNFLFMGIISLSVFIGVNSFNLVYSTEFLILIDCWD